MNFTLWPSVIGGAITGGAAIAGVVITQWNGRRQAQGDRIWEERSRAYVQAYQWAYSWALYYAHLSRVTVTGFQVTNPPRLLQLSIEHLRLKPGGGVLHQFPRISRQVARRNKW